MSSERIYVIGDRGSGVVLVKTNPLRVVEISDEELRRYSKETGSDGYAKVAASLWRLVSDIGSGQEAGGGVDETRAVGIETLVEAGVQLTDVDFVFAARSGHQGRRVRSRGETHQAHQGIDAQQAHQGVEAQQAQQGIEAQQAHQGVEAQQAQQGIEAQQAHQGVEAQKAHQGVEAQQTHQGVEAQQAHQGVEAQQAQQGADAPQSLQTHQGQQGHQGVYPPLRAALEQLFGEGGSDLRSAVLSDEPNK